MTATRLLARTVRGIEPVVAQEIRARRLGTVEHLGHREVWFRSAGSSRAVLELSCADDVFLVAATVDRIGRGRADLQRLATAAGALPVPALLAERRRHGGPPQVSTVDVSASFLGRRNYSRFDIEDTVGQVLGQLTGRPYCSRRGGRAAPAGGLSWRVTIAEDRAVLALRIAATPLHRRDYKRAAAPGSLHPPLAAAMVRLADPRPGSRLLDPCCGVGTIPIEASRLHLGLRVLGTDRALDAVAGARSNSSLSMGRVQWALADAGRLPLAAHSIDRVVTNPPWDRQVRRLGALAYRPELFWRELHRVLRPDGRAVVLLHEAEPELHSARAAGLTITDRRPVSLFGAHPTVLTLRAGPP